MATAGRGTAKQRKSAKTEVVEILFEHCWSEEAKSFKVNPPVVTSDHLVAAIEERNRRNPTGSRLGIKNPANFLKDLIRKTSANKHWPEKLKVARISARQRYGQQQVFEFIKYRTGDTIPFPDRYDPTPSTPVCEVETLSVPKSARALGRRDEAWLIQMIVSQRVVHTHLAVKSELDLVELAHLQMSVKTQPEIDAIFLATIRSGGEFRSVLVVCEAKQYKERFLEDQLREQIQLAFRMTEKLEEVTRIDAVLPMAFGVFPLTAAKDPTQGIYVAEFDIIWRKTFGHFSGDKLHELPLKLASSALYKLMPPVRGISGSKF